LKIILKFEEPHLKQFVIKRPKRLSDVFSDAISTGGLTINFNLSAITQKFDELDLLDGSIASFSFPPHGQNSITG
jgi:hypothetical protein